MYGNLRQMTALYLFRGTKVLLLFREGGRVVNHVYTGAAGGHMEAEEVSDARACVLRELQEEMGLTESDLTNLRMRYVMLRRVKDELRLNYYFFADLKEGVEASTSNEGMLRWVEVSEAADLPMPLSAKAAWKHYWEVGRFHPDAFYAGGMSDDDCGTIMELPVT